MLPTAEMATSWSHSFLCAKSMMSFSLMAEMTRSISFWAHAAAGGDDLASDVLGDGGRAVDGREVGGPKSGFGG